MDKRPWLMDSLFEIGHNMASITHIQEKKQYLMSELNNIDYSKEGDGERANSIVNELANLEELRSNIYESYNIKMTYIMNKGKKEYRCLLKHCSTSLVLATELVDSLSNAESENNLELEFQAFAGAVSLALGIEFHSCIRCIYDGVKEKSDEIGNKDMQGAEWENDNTDKVQGGMVPKEEASSLPDLARNER